MKIKGLFALGLFALYKCHKNNDDNFFLEENEKEISDDVHKNFVKSQYDRDIEFIDDEITQKSQAKTSFFETEDETDFSFKLRGSDTKMRFNNG